MRCSLVLAALAVLVSSAFGNKKVQDAEADDVNSIAAYEAQDMRLCMQQEIDISCPANFLINIEEASYGRKADKSVCPFHDPNERQDDSWYANHNCRKADSMKVVQDLCEGKQSCSLKARNPFFGITGPENNPCPGIVKYLEVKFHCYNEQRIPIAEVEVEVDGNSQSENATCKLGYSKCEDGWVMNRGQCYKYFNQGVTGYDGAEAFCAGHGAVLSSSYDAEERDILAGLAGSQQYYLNLKKPYEAFGAPDNREVKDTFWFTPHHPQAGMDCVSQRWAKWFTQPCNVNQGVACRKPAGANNEQIISYYKNGQQWRSGGIYFLPMLRGEFGQGDNTKVALDCYSDDLHDALQIKKLTLHLPILLGSKVYSGLVQSVFDDAASCNTIESKEPLQGCNSPGRTPAKCCFHKGERRNVVLVKL